MNLRIIKQRMLVHEASKWLGFTERGGNNSGQAVEMFQKFVDGIAMGEPWCMSWVQYLCGQVDAGVNAMFAMTLDHRCQLFESEHCLTVWARTPEHLRVDDPEPGVVPIWQKGRSAAGHTGVVDRVERYINTGTNSRHFYSYEGNTGPGPGIIRNGDGIYLKKRTGSKDDHFHIKAFLRPWEDYTLT